MKFLILLICLLLQSFFKGSRINKQSIVDQYFALLKPVLSKLNMDQGWKSLIGFIAPALLVILLLNALFSQITILYFFYAILILWFCLDLKDTKTDLAQYFTAMANEDFAKSQLEAEKFTLQPLSEKLDETSRAVTEAILTRSLTNLFSVIFWFMLLGLFGVIFYFLTASLERKSQQDDEFANFQAVEYLKGVLDWLPVRLMTFTFALISHFGSVINVWIEYLGLGIAENRLLLLECALAALKSEKQAYPNVIENHHALRLVFRSLWTWVIVIGLFAVFAALIL